MNRLLQKLEYRLLNLPASLNHRLSKFLQMQIQLVKLKQWDKKVSTHLP